MIQLLEPSPGLLSGSTTPRLLGAPAPYRVKSDSLSRRWRGLRVVVCGSSSSVGSRLEAGDVRAKLARREGGFECGVGVAAGAAAEGSAVAVAGVEDGGWGLGGESVRDGEKGCCWWSARDGDKGCCWWWCGRVRWCLWLS